MKQQVSIKPVVENAIGGGLEGAQQTSRETMLWTPSFASPDQMINGVKDMADARTQDLVQNDGYAAGAVNLHRDNIVGPQYVLNAQPDWVALGATEDWAEEFQLIAESRFSLIGESEECWLDVRRKNTFTNLIRLGIGGFVLTGEILSSVEWVREYRRPCRTAIQALSPARLNNPNGLADDNNLRRGIKTDDMGKALGYHIQSAYPTEWYNPNVYTWQYVPAEKPWGRQQIIHIMEQLLPSQNRGIADMVAVLKQMKMTKKFQDIVLQNAVVNATYAAAIESELPTAQAFEIIGANSGGADGSIIEGMQEYLSMYMGALGSYLDQAKNISVDGVKVPHLFPGTKFKVSPMGTPGGVGTGYEESLLRHIAACLGLSYEEFSRDFSKTNYSSGRMSTNNQWRSMQSKKAMVADRYATAIYALWLEEDIALGNIPLPPGKTRDWFYEPLVKEALTKCSWIGGSRGQIDEMKETQAALLRIKGGLSTYEDELGRLGKDWRKVFAQRAREEKVIKKLGLTFSMDTTKPGVDSAANDNPDDEDRDENKVNENAN